MTQKDRNLLAAQDFPFQSQHAKKNEQTGAPLAVLATVRFHLGPLRDMEDILDRQGMYLILGCQGMDDTHIGQAGHIDPAHA